MTRLKFSLLVVLSMLLVSLAGEMRPVVTAQAPQAYAQVHTSSRPARPVAPKLPSARMTWSG
jgi:hypothetical protein